MVSDRLPLGDGGEKINENQLKKDLARAQVEATVEELQGKLIHGVYARELRKPTTDLKVSTEWIRAGRLRVETEATLIAAQDGVTGTRAYKARVQKNGGDEFAGNTRKLWATYCRGTQATPGPCTRSATIGYYTC